MWKELEIEQDLEDALIGEFGNAEGKTLYGKYTAIRDKLPDVWEEIKRREPNLTDHGPRHIADVMRQAYQIIPKEHLSARELLALMLSILFHDTGNIHGRADHEKKISDIYDFAIGTSSLNERLQEKRIILAIVGAHGGEARDGSKDTIQDLDPSEPFLRKTIRMREIASILRFADELAEGPQRTSEYLRRVHAFDIHTEKYHDYSSITEICIDPGNNRIALTYHINVSVSNKHINGMELARIGRLLEFAYYRIQKLDEERQYAKFYSSALGNFRRTTATFHIWLDGQLLDLDLDSLELTDLVVPEGGTKSIPEINAAYKVEEVVKKIRSSCLGLSPQHESTEGTT